MSRPAIVNRFLNDILEWLRSFGRWPGFLPEPKVLKYLPDYLRLGSGYKTDDLHPGMAFGTFKGINLPHLFDALTPCFGRYPAGFICRHIQRLYLFRHCRGIRDVSL